MHCPSKKRKTNANKFTFFMFYLNKSFLQENKPILNKKKNLWLSGSILILMVPFPSDTF